MSNVDYTAQLEEILDASRIQLSDVMPSVWAEKNIIMDGSFPGPLRYEKTPYTREIIDCLARTHPAREIAVMGPAQFGKTMSIIVPALGYIIENDPGPIIMTVGHEDLLEDAMKKVDFMLDTTGLRKLIRSSAQRAKSQKTGDTNNMKEFPMGFLKLSAASNPKIWQQSSYKYGFVDDYDRVKGSTKVAGNIYDLIGKRFTSYSETKKILYTSSPDLEQDSNILKIYLMGDQRKFKVPCPCCGTFIELFWSTPKVDNEKEMCGIIWELDEESRLIENSIAYKCQECGDTFTDQNKSDYVSRGRWEPTAKPFRPDIYSYYMNSLYSPHGMSDWKHYVYQFLAAHPPGGVRDETKYQAFLNLDLGLPYKAESEAPKANQLQRNTRSYEIGKVPEKYSEMDGNGKIVLLTLQCDLNGTIDDARLDWELVGWSENGARYSIDQGSIGTFIPNQSQAAKAKADRVHWTYEYGRPNCVWPEFDKIADGSFEVDTGRPPMTPLIVGVDTGQTYNDTAGRSQAYGYLDRKNSPFFVALKGKDVTKYIRYGIDKSTFSIGQERKGLYLVHVGVVKDMVAEKMKLKWDPDNDTCQPYGFMNYPNPADNKYSYPRFFSHYESEHRILDSKDGEPIAYIWQKKGPAVQNHFWDVCVYSYALKDIATRIVCEAAGVKNYVWQDFVDIIMGRKR